MFEGLQGAVAKGAARWAGALAGGAVFGFLAAHSQVTAWLNQACASLSSADSMKEFGGGAALALLALFYGVKDKLNVKGKMASAAAAGFEKGQAAPEAPPQAKIEAVADAMKTADQASKQDKAAIVQALKTGTL